jgi:hypothetical protein
MNQTYMIVICDYPSLVSGDIITHNTRIDFVTVGQLIRGRHWRGHRYNVIVNLSRYNFDETKDERVAEWWAHIKAGATHDVEIVNGVND